MNSKHLFRVLLVLLLLLSANAHAADKVSRETFESRGKKRTVYLFVPASVETKADVPLVILLHGSGRNGLSLVEKWKDLARREGFIIAGPDSSNSQMWSETEDGPDLIRDLVEKLRAKYPVNTRRVYLFGHSAGAVFALDLAMLESEYFAATAVHAGSWRDPREFSLMDFAKRKTPLAIFVGDRDQYFSLNSVKATEAALKAKGFPIEVTVMKGHDHWYYDLAPQINRSAWEFLKGHELKEEPRYAVYNNTGAPEEVNAAVKQINALRMKFNEAMRLFFAREGELKAKGSGAERAAVAEIARAQVKLVTESADAMREAAVLAEQLSKAKLKGSFPQYFSLLAQSFGKRAEALAAVRERAELLLSDEPQTSAVTLKMNDAAMRAGRLHGEADELEQKAEMLRTARQP